MTAEIVLINVIETIVVNFMKLLKQAFVTVEITLQKLQGNSRVILKRKIKFTYRKIWNSQSLSKLDDICVHRMCIHVIEKACFLY